MRESLEITYAARTNSCTFLLDSEGFCRRILPNPALKRSPKGRDAAAAADRCIGAQYVASLDSSVPGMLAEMPRVGIPMIFARVDENGRVSLVRTGVVTQFESLRKEDPFGEKLPSMSVETSAPVIAPSRPPAERSRETAPRDRHARGEAEAAARAYAVSDPVTLPLVDARALRAGAVDVAAALSKTAEYGSDSITAQPSWSPAPIPRSAEGVRRPPQTVSPPPAGRRNSPASAPPPEPAARSTVHARVPRVATPVDAAVARRPGGR